MGRRRLANDDWGLDSNCFVCEAKNPSGLQLEFWADDDAQVVETTFSLSDVYSGAPTLVHGGLSLAILDEAQAWAVIGLARTWALTVETQSRFEQPVWVDQEVRCAAEVTGRQDDQITTRGWIETMDGTRCVTSEATFQAIGEARATSLIGTEVSEEHKGYLRRSARTEGGEE